MQRAIEQSTCSYSASQIIDRNRFRKNAMCVAGVVGCSGTWYSHQYSDATKCRHNNNKRVCRCHRNWRTEIWIPVTRRLPSKGHDVERTRLPTPNELLHQYSTTLTEHGTWFSFSTKQYTYVM